MARFAGVIADPSDSMTFDRSRAHWAAIASPPMELATAPSSASSRSTISTRAPSATKSAAETLAGRGCCRDDQGATTPRHHRGLYGSQMKSKGGMLWVWPQRPVQIPRFSAAAGTLGNVPS